MPQPDTVERFDSAHTNLSRHRQSPTASRHGRDRRFSWQSSVAGNNNEHHNAGDGDSPDEFEDAAEYIITSSRPSRSSTFSSLSNNPITSTDTYLEDYAPGIPVGVPWASFLQDEGQSDWVVTTEKKQMFDTYFNSLDTTRAGYIGGQTAAPFFAKSGLPQQYLAHIWMLSDVNDEGRLNRDTFALAMHLIEQQRGFNELVLPRVRPANYIPPSMRITPAQQVQSPWPPLNVNVTGEGRMQIPPQPQNTGSLNSVEDAFTRDETYQRLDEMISSPESVSVDGNRQSSNERAPQRPGTPTTYATKCDDCEQHSRDVNFCSRCELSFCEPCWDRQLPHRRNVVGANGIPHEKVKPAVAEKVRKVLAPPDNDDVRERLHREDALTSWFGIERPADNGPPVFRDYGRLADLMSSTNPYINGESSVFVMDGGQAGRDTRTPSLVSFVGQTGAGKSTLIKLLVDLAADDTDHFPTPVIGASGAHLPTSEDVHLYMDPYTADGQTPLLLADCEGLEGGEREPVGARVKRFGRGKPSERGDFTGRISRAIKILSECELSWADAASTRSRNFAVENLYPRLLYNFSDVIVFVLKNPR